ncbi:hypothetical protein [Actinoplanes couchii]|uniref:Uncharacterized protein n=1 Tax=Actinoplanes couchii TaxID=403638 RepID=A0ABQ3XEZ7_9ACTN|nr:hypothetical protein [Actinoplanes couchii]MDR6321956.1 hypothetical protein [Actinoplanes couchii]GID57087.1 hypothetical protein Aco03nite_054910 [Actinoplanes couchii]
MRLVSMLRRRRIAFAAGAVALVAAVTTALFVNTGPAAATWQTLSGSPTCDCVVKNSKTGEYRAVFGYVSNSTATGKIAAGANNRLELTGGSGSLDTAVTTRFEPGTHKASFATGWVSKNAQVTWSVGGKTVAAHWNRPTCGNDVSLPAGGNGLGPIIALLAAGVVFVLAAVIRRRRVTRSS